MFFLKLYVSFYKMNIGEILLKNPMNRRFFAGWKGPVSVTASGSFRIRPRLPFSVNLRFAKTRPHQEVRPNPARVAQARQLYKAVHNS